MRQLSTAVLTLFLLVWPAVGAAQFIPSPYEYIESRHTIGVFGGYLETSGGSRDLAPQPAQIYGGRYSLRLTGPLLGEVSIGVAPSTRTIYVRTANVPDPPLRAIAETDATVLLAEAGLRFGLTGSRTWRGFAPYVSLTGGLGTDLNKSPPIEESMTEDDRFSFGPTFAAGGALGTEFFVTERFSLRADFKDYFWRLTTPVNFIGVEEEQTEWRHNFALTLGTAIHF